MSTVQNLTNTQTFQYSYNTWDDQWYKAYPYSLGAMFQPDPIQKIVLGGFVEVNLPITPNNLTITTHLATNVVATLYGIVEEHSDVKFYDITIQGNTGIAPTNFMGARYGDKYVLMTPPDLNTVGRQSFKNFNLDLGGFLPEVTNTINQAVKKFNAIKNTVSSLFGGDPDGNETGVDNGVSGYKAFHNIYNFLQQYKASRASTSSISKFKQSPMKFYNYKDNNMYDCVPISFTMIRSAENPMLYNYQIRLRAFNLQPLYKYSRIFGVAETNLVAQTGLDRFKGSIFSKITSVASDVNTLVNTVSE
jgi:hypothetical protein